MSDSCLSWTVYEKLTTTVIFDNESHYWTYILYESFMDDSLFFMDTFYHLVR